jgi:undecaprenyl-diphosphatase
MVDLLQGVLMAIFQGVIEWLPISSEGQLSLLFVNLLNMTELEAVTLALLLHTGTMISVLWCFRDEFIQMISIPDGIKAEITIITIIATLGTGITAIPLIIFFKAYWEVISQNLPIGTDILFSALIGVLLIITGIILSKQPEQGTREFTTITRKEALFLGMVQGVAALPGISRSGMTITVLLIIGLTQKDALRISFIISVPAVLGATALEFILNGFSLRIDALIIGNIIFPYWLLFLTILLTVVIGVVSMNALLQLKDIPYDKFCIGFGAGTIILTFMIFIASLTW